MVFKKKVTKDSKKNVYKELCPGFFCLKLHSDANVQEYNYIMKLDVKYGGDIINQYQFKSRVVAIVLFLLSQNIYF